MSLAGSAGPCRTLRIEAPAPRCPLPRSPSSQALPTSVPARRRCPTARRVLGWPRPVLLVRRLEPSRARLRVLPARLEALLVFGRPGYSSSSSGRKDVDEPTLATSTAPKRPSDLLSKSLSCPTLFDPSPCPRLWSLTSFCSSTASFEKRKS